MEVSKLISGATETQGNQNHNTAGEGKTRAALTLCENCHKNCPLTRIRNGQL